MATNPFGAPPPAANPFAAAVAPSTAPAANPFATRTPGASPFGTPVPTAAGLSTTSKLGVTGQKNNLSKRRNNSGIEPSDGTRQLSQFAYDYAKRLHSHLEKENISPPKWPQEPGNPKRRNAVESLKEGYKKYRTRVYSSLRKADLIDDPNKRRRLQDALDFKGICEEMCPDFEKCSRIAEYDVTSEEKQRPSDGGTPWAEPSLMVKKFARSAAGQDAPLPMDVRSVDALRRTTDYLIDELLQDDSQLPAMHNYLWDRLRAVRKDFTFHSTKTPAEMKSLVYCFENIARFHATALHLLSRKGFAEDGFDQKQEIEQLGRTVLSLIEAYDLCHEKKVKCENEPEFRAYYLLLNAFAPSIIQRIPTWGDEYWFDSEEVQIALSLINSMEDVRSRKGPIKPRRPASLENSMFTNFFSIVEQPNVSYTMACMAEVHFTNVRQCVLRNLVKGYARHRDAPRHITAKCLNQFLRFDTPEEAVEFAGLHSFEFSTENPRSPSQPEKEAYLVLNSRNRYVPSPRVQQSYSGKIVERKRGSRPLPLVIHNTVFASEGSAPEHDEGNDDLFVSQDPVPKTQNGVVNGTLPNASPFGNPAPTTSVFGGPLPSASITGGRADGVSQHSSSPFGGFNKQAKAMAPVAKASGLSSTGNPSLFGNATMDQTTKAPEPSQGFGFSTPSLTATSGPPSTTTPPLTGLFAPSTSGTPVTGVLNPNASILGTLPPFGALKKQSQLPSFKGNENGSPFGTPSHTQNPVGSATGAAASDNTPLGGRTADTPSSTVSAPISSAFSAFKKPALANAPNASSFGKHTEAHSIQPPELSLKGLAPTPIPAPPGVLAQTTTTAAGSGMAPSILAGLAPAPSPATSALPAAMPPTLISEQIASQAKGRGSVTFATAPLDGQDARSVAPQFSGQPKGILKRPHEAEESSAAQGSSDVPGEVHPILQSNPLAQADVRASPPKKQDLMGDFARWFVLGDGGVMEQFTDVVVEDFLAKAFSSFQREEEERRRREEDEQSWREAREFQVYNLSVKYFYRWRQIAHERRRKSILEDGKRRQREYWASRSQRLRKEAEETASQAKFASSQAEKKAREDATALLSIARQSGRSRADAEMRMDGRLRLSTASSERSIEDELLATGIFSGMADERETARRVVQEAQNGAYMPPPVRRQLSRSVGSGSFYQQKRSKTDALREKMGLDKSRRFSASTSFNESRTNFSASSSFSTTRSRKRSAEESNETPSQKRLTMFKSLHFEMRARGFVPTANGGWRHETDSYRTSVVSSRPPSSCSSTTPLPKRKREVECDDELVVSSPPPKKLISSPQEPGNEHTLESIEESSRALQQQLEELRALMSETGAPFTD